jgi:hypothetical protein
MLTAAILISFVVGFAGGASFFEFVVRRLFPAAGGIVEPVRAAGAPAVPMISLKTPCPACGNMNCEIDYDAQKKKVARECKVCHCVVLQDPVAPDFFR